MEDRSLETILKLWLIKDLGLKTINKILNAAVLQHKSNLNDIFQISVDEIAKKYQIPLKHALLIQQNKHNASWKYELAKASDHKVKIISLFDKKYPYLLKQIAYPPPIIYYKGNIEFDFSRSISIVGTRNASMYGVNCTKKIIKQLAKIDNQITIISGLAIGIDSIAHKCALENRLKTIAVLGNGLASIYPKSNTYLAEQILGSGGALISEVPVNNAPLAKNFPLRNRIISGLSPVLMVMEASLKSGSLITARLAQEQNREVFALPGPIDAASYEGSLSYIKQSKANLLTKAEDVILFLDTQYQRQSIPTQVLNNIERSQQKTDLQFNSLIVPALKDELETKIFNCLSNNKILIDEIINETGLDTAKVLGVLMEFQMRGFLEHKENGSYQLKPNVKFKLI